MTDVLLYARDAGRAGLASRLLSDAGLSVEVRDPCDPSGLPDLTAYALVLTDPDPLVRAAVVEGLSGIPSDIAPTLGVLSPWAADLPIEIQEAVPLDQNGPAFLSAVSRALGKAEMRRSWLRQAGARVSELARNVAQYAALHAVTGRMTQTLVLSDSLQAFVDGAREILGLEVLATLLADEGTEELKVVAVSPSGAHGSSALESGLNCLRRASATSGGVPRFPCVWPRDGIVAVPVVVEGRGVGAVLAVRSRDHAPERPLDEIASALAGMSPHIGNAVRNAHLYALMETRSAQMTALSAVGRALSAVHELQTLLDLVCNHATAITGAARCSVMLLDEHEGVLRIRASRGVPPRVRDTAAVRIGEGIAGYVFDVGEPLLVADIEADERFDSRADTHYFGDKSLVVVPLLVHGVPAGVLNLTRKVGRKPFDTSDLELAVLLASHAGIAIDNAYLYDELRTLAATDSLTRLLNHRHFMARLAAAMSHARRRGRPVSVLMLDIDHFKRINDTYGHHQGDRVLQAFSALLRRTAREEDILGRYGGDEFAVAVPDTDAAGAVRLANRVRERVGRLAIPKGDDVVTFTLSVGVAQLEPWMRSPEDLTDCADQALYHAKSEARDRVCPHAAGELLQVGGRAGSRRRAGPD